MSDRLPITPITPAQRLETQRATDVGRAQMFQLDAERRVAEARARSAQTFFTGMGELGQTLSNIAERIGERDAISTRMEAETAMRAWNDNYRKEAATSEKAGSEIYSDYLAEHQKKVEELSSAIRYVPQDEIFRVGERERGEAMAVEMMNLADAKAMRRGQVTTYNSIQANIDTGNPEDIEGIVKDAVGAGFLDPKVLEPGGFLDDAQRRAQITNITKEADLLYQAEDGGLTKSKRWVLDASNHDDRFNVTINDLEGIAQNLDKREAIEKEAARELLNEELANFTGVYNRIKHGEIKPPNTMDEADLVVEEHAPSAENLDKAEMAGALMDLARKGIPPANPADQEKRNRESLVMIETEGQDVEYNQLSAFGLRVNALYINGNITETTRNRLINDVVEQGRSEERERVDDTVIVPTFTLLRNLNAANERDYEQKHITIHGTEVYVKDERMDFGDKEGEWITFTNEDGEIRISVTELESQVRDAIWKVEASAFQNNQMVQLEQVARQVVAQTLAKAIPGREIEGVDAGVFGDLDVSPEKIARNWLGKKWFKEDYKYDTSIYDVFDSARTYAGAEGTENTPLRAESTPLSEFHTGEHAVNVAMKANQEWASSPWVQQGMEELDRFLADGEVVDASFQSANLMPRDPEALEALAANGDLHYWEHAGDVDDGAYRVQFVEGGMFYPVLPLERDHAAAVDTTVSAPTEKREPYTTYFGTQPVTPSPRIELVPVSISLKNRTIARAEDAFNRVMNVIVRGYVEPGLRALRGRSEEERDEEISNNQKLERTRKMMLWALGEEIDLVESEDEQMERLIDMIAE